MQPYDILRSSVLTRNRQCFHPLLSRYFSSGWAFFIPYVAAYALFQVMDWPVHRSVSELARATHFQLGNPPSAKAAQISLFEVFWCLHGLNALLGIAAC